MLLEKHLLAPARRKVDEALACAQELRRPVEKDKG